MGYLTWAAAVAAAAGVAAWWPPAAAALAGATAGWPAALGAALPAPWAGQAEAALALALARLPPSPAQVGAALLAWVVLVLAYRCVEGKVVVPPPPLKGWETHHAEAAAVAAHFGRYLAARAPGQMVSINRSRGGQADSNRTSAADYKAAAVRVDVSALDGVIAIDAAAHVMHIQPGLPMDEMARVAIAHGFVPLVVLEFPGITAGGAVCGGGIESSSHKWGCFFDTVVEVDIVTGDGRHRTGVSRTREPDLFAALSASFGTHGIITRLAVRVEPAPRLVHVRYLHFASLAAATDAMAAAAGAAAPPAFIDGVAMSPTSSMVVLGDGCEEAPAGVPTITLRAARTDPWFFWHLTTLARALPALPKAAARPDAVRAQAGHAECMSLDDYLFRFDRGAFWMARHGLQVFYGGAAYGTNPAAPAGPALLLRFKYAWLCTTRQLYRMLHGIGDVMLARTYVVQDYIMPGKAEACALAEYTAGNGLGIWPLWICPVRMVGPRHPANAGFGFPVQATPPGGLMVNVGVYGQPAGGAPFDPVVVNTALEGAATALGGRKMLYAQSFYSERDFWALFDKAAYDRVRKAYGGAAAFPDVAVKLLLGPARLARMAGVKAVSFLDAAAPMAAWYASLWQELLLPRALHAALDLNFTGMTTYARVAHGGAGGEAAVTTASAEDGARVAALPPPASPAARRARSRSQRR
jgi:delta24-sterol reductase